MRLGLGCGLGREVLCRDGLHVTREHRNVVIEGTLHAFGAIPLPALDEGEHDFISLRKVRHDAGVVHAAPLLAVLTRETRHATAVGPVHSAARKPQLRSGLSRGGETSH